LTGLFYLVLAIPLVVVAASPLSLWMRRATLSLVGPVLLGAGGWCLVVLPFVRRSAGCDSTAAMSQLLVGGGLTTVVCAGVALGTLWRLSRLQPRWGYVLPAAVLTVVVEAGAVFVTGSVSFGWAFDCY
jgi:hypothetical protein